MTAPAEEPAIRGRSPGRRLGLAVAGLLVAALALWGASRLVWVTAVWDVPLRGRVVGEAAGADAEPVLVGWALLALAAVAGVLATSGWGRRLVGVVVALAGAWAAVRAVAALAAPPPDALPAAAVRAGRAVAVDAGVVGPLVAAAGGLVLAAVGVLVVVAAPRLPRLGARYDAPGARAGAGTPDAARRRPRDPDQELWAALDEGRDPTGEPAAPGAHDGLPGPPGPSGAPRGSES